MEFLPIPASDSPIFLYNATRIYVIIKDYLKFAICNYNLTLMSHTFHHISDRRTILIYNSSLVPNYSFEVYPPCSLPPHRSLLFLRRRIYQEHIAITHIRTRCDFIHVPIISQIVLLQRLSSNWIYVPIRLASHWVHSPL